VIGKQIWHYNHERRHSRLGYRPPLEYLVTEGFIPETLAETWVKSGSALGAQVRAMRILLFDFVVGGHHSQYASYIIRYLVEQGDKVTFISWQPDESVERLREEGADVRYVTGRSRSMEFGGSILHRFWQISRGIRYSFALASTWQADVVHHLYLERSELPLYLQMLSTRKRSWKLFATLFWPYFIHEHQEKVNLPKCLYHRVNRWALGQLLGQKKLDGLFVHTRRIKKMLVELYGDVSLQQWIFVVPDPVEPLAKVSQEMARNCLGLPQDKPVILFFGGLRWDKGPDILLEALTMLEGDWYAVIAGESAQIGEAEVTRCREKLREPERLITRLGFIPDEDVAKYFAAADAVVLPYRRAFKGTSGVLQHAAAAGKPVIATDVGEVGPTVREHGLGIVVEPESPSALAKGIREFLTRKDKLTVEIRPRALQYAEANDWRIMARKVREAYLSVVGE